MALISFYKYHGAGNDFILLDQRNETQELTKENIAFLCDRHFGIGADGLMYLRPPQSPGTHFHMVYFNSDGRESSMCGNGGRCIVQFASHLGIVENEAHFTAIDGTHWARINEDATVALGMNDIDGVQILHGGYFLNTGSPHHVEWRAHVGENFVQEARDLRHQYGAEGSNINFVHVHNGTLHIRTYERGVEDETLACGTGCVAAAAVALREGWLQGTTVPIQALGGTLTVALQGTGPFTNVVLTGPAQFVFEGKIEID